MIDDRITRLPHGEGLPLPSYATERRRRASTSSRPRISTLAPGQRHAVATGFAIAIPAGLRGPGPPALGPRAQARHHLPQHARHDRQRLSRRSEGDPHQPRRRALRRSAAASALPSWSRRRCRAPHFDEVDELVRNRARRGGFGSTGAVTEPHRRRTRPLRAPHRPAAGRRGRAARLKAASVAVVGAGGIGSAAHPGARRRRGRPADDYRRRRGRRCPTSSASRSSAPTRSDSPRPRSPQLSRERNPHVAVEPVADRIDAANAEAMLAGHDLILDGTDNFATRLTSAIPRRGSASRWCRPPRSNSRGRSRCFAARQPCYRCFVGDAFDADDCDTCAELGVLGALTAMVGNFAALMAIRAIAGLGADAAGIASPVPRSGDLAAAIGCRRTRRAAPVEGRMRRTGDLDAKDREILALLEEDAQRQRKSGG